MDEIDLGTPRFPIAESTLSPRGRRDSTDDSSSSDNDETPPRAALPRSAASHAADDAPLDTRAKPAQLPPSPGHEPLRVEDTLRRIARVLFQHLQRGESKRSRRGPSALVSETRRERRAPAKATTLAPLTPLRVPLLSAAAAEGSAASRTGLGLLAAEPHGAGAAPLPLPGRLVRAPSAQAGGMPPGMAQAGSVHSSSGSPVGIALQRLTPPTEPESAAGAEGSAAAAAESQDAVQQQQPYGAVSMAWAAARAWWAGWSRWEADTEVDALADYLAEVDADPFHEARFIRAQWQLILSDPNLMGWFSTGPIVVSRRVRHTFAPPTVSDVFDFAAALFARARLTAESSVVALIYVERLLERGGENGKGVRLRAQNWRPILLAGLLLASKVWDDLGSWAVEFAAVYPQYAVASVVAAERAFVGALRFDLFVSAETYARYYYALRALHEQKTGRRGAPSRKHRYLHMLAPSPSGRAGAAGAAAAAALVQQSPLVQSIETSSRSLGRHFLTRGGRTRRAGSTGSGGVGPRSAAALPGADTSSVCVPSPLKLPQVARPLSQPADDNASNLRMV